jgi:predicted GNAT family acetyltransferase
MESLTIERKEDGGRGTYVATVAGIEGDARLVYRYEAPDVMAAVHTQTSGELRGRGIALKLVERLVEDARREGMRVRAVCSYVERERRNHEQWADVFLDSTK